MYLSEKCQYFGLTSTQTTILLLFVKTVKFVLFCGFIDQKEAKLTKATFRE